MGNSVSCSADEIPTDIKTDNEPAQKKLGSVRQLGDFTGPKIGFKGKKRRLEALQALPVILLDALGMLAIPGVFGVWKDAEKDAGSSSHHLWVPPEGISWVLLKVSPGSSLRRLQVPPGAIETVKIFGINKPMQLGGDEAPLPLKANWDGLETRSLSGSQDLYNLTGSSADDGKS
ncbi:hypothetical protein HGM15179_006103, partial [Zosterops borbonicus]